MTNPYTHVKRGTRSDLGVYVRSKVEANYIRFLNFVKVKWIYEPRIFYFDKIRRGTRSYTPDLLLPDEDSWVEIKIWFRQRDMTALKRFKYYYPEEFKKLRFVIHDPFSEAKKNVEAMKFLVDVLGIDADKIESYKEIKRYLAPLIPNWEV